MAEDSKQSIDLEDVRHNLTTAIGILETAIEDLQPRIEGAEDTFEMHNAAMNRLRKVLADLDAALG